jgi:CheY-like chemotaxis protein
MNKLILIADDDYDTRTLLKFIINRQMPGVQIMEAEDGDETLLLSAQRPPDLILMDGNMPVINGWEAANRLRAKEQTAHIPIIFLTAEQNEIYRRKCSQFPNWRYLSKPVSMAELVGAITEALAQPVSLVS